MSTTQELNENQRNRLLDLLYSTHTMYAGRAMLSLPESTRAATRQRVDLQYSQSYMEVTLANTTKEAAEAASKLINFFN